MSKKDIAGFLTVIPSKDGRPVDGKVLQAGNIAFKNVAQRRTIFLWDNNNVGVFTQIVLQPFKNAYMLDDADDKVGHGMFLLGTSFGGADSYPIDNLNGAGAPTNMGTEDFSRFRQFGSYGTAAAVNQPRVLGCVGSLEAATATTANSFAPWGTGNALLALNDLPLDYTQIGIVYGHPATWNAVVNVTTAVGSSFVTMTNAGVLDQLYMHPYGYGAIRITAGADAGLYFVTAVDTTNNRLYLRTLNGTTFLATAAATVASELYAPRRAFFNESLIIPLSVGAMQTSGRYAPKATSGRDLRTSFIARIYIDKTGSDETASSEQQGSYVLGMRPFTHGDGVNDFNLGFDYNLGSIGANTADPSRSNINFFDGGCSGLVLNEEDDRAWFGMTNASNQSGICHWRWRTNESFREVANYLGTAGHAGFVSPALVLGAGDVIRSGNLGSDKRVYFGVSHASAGNAGIIIIKPDLTTLQYTIGSSPAFPSNQLAGTAMDRSRTRSFADISTTAASNTIVDNVGTTFTAADIGRCIQVVGGADAGFYLISVINSTSNVTVTTMAGAGVTFTGSSNRTGSIGDRIYLFFANNTTGAAKINYMESLQPGTWLTRAVTMTNGANCNVFAKNGEPVKISVDQANGNVYWLSNDTQQQINKYDVTANSHALIAINNASLLAPAGGVVMGGANPANNPGSPTVFTAIRVNSKFDEIWVGSDQGHFKIVKSTFSTATIKRYFGTEATTWWQGTAAKTGTGNGTTGLAFSTPNVTLNSSGTPFTANDIGKFVIITGATTAGNNGAFPITAVNSSSQLVFTNSSGAAQSNYAGTWYISPDAAPRSAGNFATTTSSNFVRAYWEQPDGRILSSCNSSADTQNPRSFYSRAMDAFFYLSTSSIGVNSVVTNQVTDSSGWRFEIRPGAVSSSVPKNDLMGQEIHYQWDNANTKWIPLEHQRQGLPNKSVSDTTVPNMMARPIHSSFQALMFGVSVRFTKQGGATPSNNEFLGRAGQTRSTSADGATTTGSANFDGSGFSAGDAGRILRIESGSDVGVYRINTFVNSTRVTLANMGGLSAYSALATASSLSYTVWDAGSVGSNNGPESYTVLMADGVSKDNTQDLTGITYDSYAFKTRLHEFDESRKFAVENPLAPPGSLAMKAYHEPYARATGLGTYDAAISHHKALPGAETSNGRHMFDWILDKILNGTGAMADIRSSPSNPATWFGRDTGNGATGLLGYSLMVDFGVNVEVGYVQLRLKTNSSAEWSGWNTITGNGLLGNMYRASGSAPVASSVVRTSGTTNLSISGANVRTATLGSGDFLGSIRSSGGPFANGAIVSGASTFSDTTNTPFLSTDVGMILKITAGAGADIGSYRIIGFTSSSVVTIRNLDQTAKQWTVTASSITYEIRDGVQEEDMIAQPSVGSPTHRFTVERLTSPTSAELRNGPTGVLSNVSWECAKPTWTLVKRLSYSVDAQPPDVKNNGTWVSLDGREQFDNKDAKIYFDLSDLSSANRTGRYWKWTAMPRFNTNSVDGSHFVSTLEFFDPTGNRIGISKYTIVDEARTNADYLFSNMTRLDFIQAANDAMAGVSGFNGNVNLGGGGGDTLTLNTGGNKFLGFQLGPKISDAGLPTGTNQINSAGSAWPVSAMIGRFVRVITGANAGTFYRVASRPSPTQITVTTPSGSAVSWGGTETNIEVSFHEGINVGGATADYVRFADGREFTLNTINDALTSITIVETGQPARTNVAWEIIRPGYPTTSSTTDATKTSRLVTPTVTFPLQSGDVAYDSRGAMRFFSEDIGNGDQRADGVIAGGSGAVTGTLFSPDDVGRLLYITTGANVGVYEISVFTSATSITVKNHYTGAAVSLTADAGPVTYQIFGLRRYRNARFVVGLRA